MLLSATRWAYFETEREEQRLKYHLTLRSKYILLTNKLRALKCQTLCSAAKTNEHCTAIIASETRSLPGVPVTLYGFVKNFRMPFFSTRSSLVL